MYRQELNVNKTMSCISGVQNMNRYDIKPSHLPAITAFPPVQKPFCLHNPENLICFKVFSSYSKYLSSLFWYFLANQYSSKPSSPGILTSAINWTLLLTSVDSSPFRETLWFGLVETVINASSNSNIPFLYFLCFIWFQTWSFLRQAVKMSDSVIVGDILALVLPEPNLM